MTYSVGNYGKSAAVIERVQEQMRCGDPTVMFANDEDQTERKDPPLLMARVFSADFATVGIEYLIPYNRIAHWSINEATNLSTAFIGMIELYSRPPAAARCIGGGPN